MKDQHQRPPAPPPAPAAGGADGKAINAEKRQKYELKQKKKQEMVEREKKRSQWAAANAHFARVVCANDVENLRRERDKDQAVAGQKRKAREADESSPVDELIAPYLDLKEGDSSNGHLFIAEGTETVRLLIQQSTEEACQCSGDCGQRKPIKIVSVLVRPSSFFEEPVKLISEVKKTACSHQVMAITCSHTKTKAKQSQSQSPPFHVLIASEDVQSRIAGFHIARGALACGVIPKYDEKWLDAFLANKTKPKIDEGKSESSHSSVGLRVLALDGISDTANMGTMIRCCAAFGIELILLSSDCCDPWYRRSIRTSMGHVASIPIVRCESLSSALSRMEKDNDISSFAAVIDLDSELVLERMEFGEVPPRWCCVMGNEGNGISKQVVAACTSRLRIGMSAGVDSLSVPVATGILLHGLAERERKQEIR